MKLQNKTFIVTGGGNGVGQALVLNLLKKGARVAAVDISEGGLAKTAVLAKSYKTHLSTHILDISDLKSVEKFPGIILHHHPSIDGLINNAGVIQPFENVKDNSYSTIQRVFNINFFGTLYFIKTFLPYLLERPEASMTNISSFGALSPVPGETIYGASKSAVRMLTEGLIMELKRTNIHMMLAIPGGINSDIIANSNATKDLEYDRLRKKFAFLLLSPEKASDIIIHGIEKNRKRILLGIDTKIIDIASRIFPRAAGWPLYQIIQSVLHS